MADKAHPCRTLTACKTPGPRPEALLFGDVQACAGRLGAAPLSPLQGTTPAAWQSQFRGACSDGAAPFSYAAFVFRALELLT